MDVGKFKGKRALVTGAGKGIGRGTVEALVKCGAEVIALSRTQADLDSLKSEFPSIQTICVDVTDIEGVRKAINGLDDIHLLVNNAGVAQHEEFLDAKPETFDVTYDVNVKGAMFLAQAVARKMISCGCSGAIVNVSSNLATKAVYARSVYSSCKAALNQLTKGMALELGKYQIRVNAVMPGLVMTEMSRKFFDDVKLKEVIDGVPLGKLTEIKDVVNAILFLLSDQAAMIHGAMLPVDGGFIV